MKIAVVDYGMGNLRSVIKKINKIGFHPVLSSDADEIITCEKLILPGVGHFEKGMRNLRSLGLIDVIRTFALAEKKPLLGICLGMQMLTDFSEEGDVAGLGFIRARTSKFKFSGNSLRVPHMGWNTIQITGRHAILNGVPENELFYFAHSYHVKCESSENEIAKTHYGLEFSSIIADGNIVGVQFHPEKSHEWGELLIKNFCEM